MEGSSLEDLTRDIIDIELELWELFLSIIRSFRREEGATKSKAIAIGEVVVHNYISLCIAFSSSYTTRDSTRFLV